jgi:Flp pilus assembly protein TadD
MTAEDEPAIRVLTRAHELRPDDGNVRRLLAQELMVVSEVLAKRNDLQRARVLLQQAATLRPDSEEISSKLAQLRARISGNP